jgi:hypothetical protein
MRGKAIRIAQHNSSLAATRSLRSGARVRFDRSRPALRSEDPASRLNCTPFQLAIRAFTRDHEQQRRTTTVEMQLRGRS